MSWKTSVPQKRLFAHVKAVLVLGIMGTVIAALTSAQALSGLAVDAERHAEPSCYNSQRDGNEIGIDCGGSCPLQDCCSNRAWDDDLGELGVDCDGTCPRACQPADRLDRWTQTNGPWLEYIRRIRFDPGDANTLIVASNTGSGVAKSTDGGQTWHLISGPGRAGGISPMNVFGLAMDPVDESILYAGTANGRLYRTTNGGATWSLLWEYTEVDDALWTVEVDPSNRERLFIGTGDYNRCDGRLYLSEDGGGPGRRCWTWIPPMNWTRASSATLPSTRRIR